MGGSKAVTHLGEELGGKLVDQRREDERKVETAPGVAKVAVQAEAVDLQGAGRR